LFTGPLSNGVSCATCHSVPVTGGGSTVTERRVGRIGDRGLTTSLVHDHAIVNGNCNAQTESFSNLTADTKRMTTPLFGAGLVDAVDDTTFLALETAESTTTTPGHANIVQNRVTGGTSVGKFGWKS